MAVYPNAIVVLNADQSTPTITLEKQVAKAIHRGQGAESQAVVSRVGQFRAERIFRGFLQSDADPPRNEDEGERSPK